jgi:hypothetical protein
MEENYCIPFEGNRQAPKSLIFRLSFSLLAFYIGLVLWGTDLKIEKTDVF